MEDKKLFLLDAYALIFRAYYALLRAPRFTVNGLNTSAIFGFVNTLQEILKKENPSHIAVCFDPPGPTFRHEAYEGYKAERDETPEDIKLSVPYIKDIIRAYNIPIIEVPGYEADDVIGTLATLAEKRGFTTYMMTPDKDFCQLVTDKIKVYRPAYKGGEFEIRGVAEVLARYGLQNTSQVIDLLALMGDQADNIPGCRGVGEKTAVKLISEFGSVENLLENTDKLKGSLHDKVVNDAENIRFSKFLATIKTDVPVEFDEEALRRSEINTDALKRIFEQLEFRTLLARIIPKPQPIAAPKPKAETRQASLFDFDDDTPAEAPAPAAPTAKVQCDVKPMKDAAEIGALIEKALKAGKAGFALVADGDSSITATLIGAAITTGDAAGYVDAADIALFKPFFESREVLKIGTNVKRDMILLRRIGISFAAPYADTAVMHYLIQPELSHDYNRLAETYLSTEVLTEEALRGGKGKSRIPYSDIPAEMTAKFAGEMASTALALHPLLLAEIGSLGMNSLLDDIETPFVAVLADMEYTGVTIDTSVLNAFSKSLTAQMCEMEKECYALAGEEFNTSSPAQVGEILFEKLALDPKAKRGKNGKYSTTEEVLSKLKDRHPIVDLILRLRGVKKLLATYVNALPELVNPVTGRIHTTYNQTITATGRISSSNPNMQNIPVRDDEGREIRKAFVPSPGNLFFSADYSQIELRLVADISGDETMIASFLSGEDIHRSTAAKIYHVPLDEVTPDMRRHAKTANFGILYGISAFGLAERLGISRGDANVLLDGYRKTYPRITEYMQEVVADAKEKGYVTTKFGRRRMLPDINSRNAVVRGYSERNAVNAPIQGTAADVIKIAMVKIFARFAAEGVRSKMTMQVHDELNFDVIPEELPLVTKIVTEEMQNAYHGRVPLIASYSQGANWLEAH
ncbi:MAG: DNA polymerase I [Muribaculaceae bacterium]